MPDNLEAIVQRMIDANESEENIAAVIQGYQPATEAPKPPADDLPGLEGAPSFLRLLARGAKAAYENPMAALGAAGAAASVPLTGGATLPGAIAAAGLGGAGGAGLGAIVKAIRGDADTPQTPGAVVGAMGREGATQALGQATGALAAGAARGSLRLMQSALKPSASLVKARAGAGIRSGADVAKTVLEQGRIVTPGSLSKAQMALDATDEAAQAALTSGAGKGVTIDSGRVADAIGDTGRQFGAQINAQPDVAAVNAVRRNFVSNPRVSDPVGGIAPLPADVAHTFASNTGKNLKGKFGRLGGATVEAEKAGRASITQQLREGIPELEPLWQQEAAQITTRDALEQALARRSNTDPIGLTGMVGMLKSPAAMATAAADRSAAAKSFLAQALRKSAGPLEVLPDAVRLALLSRISTRD